MEQHLYSFLTKRYVTKPVIMEWASAIFRAIQRFAGSECDVAVFGKILQNSLSESFPAVQDTLRATVQQLLRAQLEQKHSQRSPTEIDALWRDRLRSGVPLNECDEVVCYMFNEQDSSDVCSRLKTFAAGRPSPVSEMPVVPYRDFVQQLLHFQMQLTVDFLSDFVAIFREVDSDDDGAIADGELEELVDRLADVRNAVSASALEQARTAALESIAKREEDHNASGGTGTFGRATFSECVDLFTELISARWAATGKSHGP